MSYRTRANADTWQRWANALSSYNLANTDSDSVSLATDWTLMCGSFQLVLDADSKSEDVGAKFASAVAPQTDMLSSESARNSDRFQKEPRLALREEWMREFYRIRGNLAHGWLEPKQPAAWSAAEHLTLARLTFPLLAKTRLATCGLYTMTEDDEIWLSRLEQVADSQDLTKGYEMEREMPSIKTEREYRRASEKLKAALNVPAHAESLGLTRKRDSLDSESGTANNDEAEKRTDA